MVFIAALLAALRKERQRVVIVSNFTERLNWLSMYCKLIHYPTIQFDSSVCVDSKTQMVECFNNPDCYEFAFLLSSKAGGCGQNLVGGASLIMVDTDWNPANDEQATGATGATGRRSATSTGRSARGRSRRRCSSGRSRISGSRAKLPRHLSPQRGTTVGARLRSTSSRRAPCSPTPSLGVHADVRSLLAALRSLQLFRMWGFEVLPAAHVTPSLPRPASRGRPSAGIARPKCKFTF